MSIASYRWKTETKERTPFKICISDKLNKLIPHAQSELELMYFYKTSGASYFCAGKELSFEGGDLAIVNPGEVHGCDNWGEGCIAACVIIDVKMLEVPLLIGKAYNNKIVKNHEISGLFENLYELLTDNTKGKTELLCRVNAIIYNLFGALCGETVDGKRCIGRGKEMEEILLYIRENIEENIRISQLAEKIHLSEDRFYHIFKEYVGISPSEYILSCRMEKGSNLLYTKLKISDIAQRCGFCTSSYFSERFIKIYGITPSEYRRRERFDDLK